MTMWHFYRKQTVTWLRAERVRRGFEPGKGESKEWLAESLGGDDSDRGVRVELAQRVTAFVLEHGGRWLNEDSKSLGLELPTTFGTLVVSISDNYDSRKVCICSRFEEKPKSYVTGIQQESFENWSRDVLRTLVDSGDGAPRWTPPRRCYFCGVAHHKGCDPVERATYEARQKVIEAEQDAEREREILAILTLPNEDWLDGFGELSKRVNRVSDPRIKARLTAARATGAKRREEYAAERKRISAECAIDEPLRKAVEKHRLAVDALEAHDEWRDRFEDVAAFADSIDEETGETTPGIDHLEALGEALSDTVTNAATKVRDAWQEHKRAMAALDTPSAPVVDIAPPIAAKPRTRKRAAKLVSVAVEPEVSAPVAESNPWDTAPFVPMFQNR